MPLRGKGMLVVYSEVKSLHERDFNEWYNREHVDERLGMPGFQRARRWVAVKGSPKYLATYECDTVGDLATPGYLALLANQTPWTQAVMARFTQFHRLALRVQVDLAHGVGGAVAAVRFVPDPRERKALAAWLQETALPKAIARPGLVGAVEPRKVDPLVNVLAIVPLVEIALVARLHLVEDDQHSLAVKRH